MTKVGSVRRRHSGRCIGAAVALAMLTAAASAQAWTFTEHTRLSYESIKRLGTRDRWNHDPRVVALQAAWAQARTIETSSQQRLCPSVFRYAPEIVGLRPGGTAGNSDDWCLSFTPLPAIAADHSCSPQDLAEIVLHSKWLPAVLREAALVGKQVVEAGDDPAKLLTLRQEHDIGLMLEDDAYLSRAEGSTAHFQLPRRTNDLGEYLADALAAGAPANTVALYANFHAAALREAHLGALLADDCRQGSEHACRLAAFKYWNAFTAEAFALHFLQDSFAAGHTTGAWGPTAEAKGTHDYYCRHGLDAVTWDGESYVAHGDLYMTDEDVRQAAEAGAASLGQLAEVLLPLVVEHGQPLQAPPATGQALWDIRQAQTRGFLDVCAKTQVPAGLEPLAHAGFIRDAVEQWPRPTRRSPSLPRHRIELGFFMGPAAAVDFGPMWSNVGATTNGEIRGKIDMRFGAVADGLLSRGRYGRAYLGFTLAGLHHFNWEDSAVGVGLHVHTPFAYIPGDGIIYMLLLSEAGVAATPAMHASRGSYYYLNHPVVISEKVTFQCTALREISFLRYFPHGSGPTAMPARWEILVPAANFSFGNQFHDELAIQSELDLGYQYVDLGDHLPSYHGLYLSLSAGTRWYP